jgi:anthranilate phosphoribosyltransferase
VLKELGTRAALVVYGAENTDELNTCGPNRVSHLKDGAVRTYELDPVEFGMSRASLQDLRGGLPTESAAMMRTLFQGKLNGALRDTVLLNAAAAIAAEDDDMQAALEEAVDSLDSGKALTKLDALIEFSQNVGQQLSIPLTIPNVPYVNHPR